MIAQVAAALVNGTKRAHMHAGPFHLVAGVGTLIAVAFALTLVRLAMQIPISILPARIAADVQAQLRQNLFHAFTRASWEVQSRDREGQLQETMTSQMMQATGGALQATGLITIAVQLPGADRHRVRCSTPMAAGHPARGACCCSGCCDRCSAIGVRRARALSQAQVRYAGGISEAIRLAEETQVFGVAGAQRSAIDGLVAHARRPLPAARRCSPNSSPISSRA